MADNPDLLRVGASGKAYVGAVGVVAPTSIRLYDVGPPVVYTPVAYGVGWTDLGLISEDGLTEALDEDRSEWTPWGYNSPVRSQITSEATTFEFTCWETNAEVLSLRYRTPIADMVSAQNNTEVHFDQVQRTSPDMRAFGFDVIDGDNHFRYICPRAEVTERGDVDNKADDPIGYSFTVTAYPGTDGVAIRRMYLAQIDITP